MGSTVSGYAPLMRDRHELLVVGGGPAGLAAARAFRTSGGCGPVAIIADEHRMPYRRPPLTKELLRGEGDEDDLPLEPEEWLQEQGVTLISGRAVDLDPQRHEVTLSGGRVLGYRHCLLATGAEPVRAPVPGADDPGVRVVRTLQDVRDLRARLRPDDPVIVVGAGFVGCEAAASLRMLGHPVSVVCAEPAPNHTRLGEDAAARIAEWLDDLGIVLYRAEVVCGIVRARAVLSVRTDARELRAPVVVMASGVAPRSELAVNAGLTLHEGAIPVDEAMRTSVEGLYAAGDVAYARNVTAGRSLRVEHWGDALGQGEVAGRAAAGLSPEWTAVPGFWSTIGTRTLKYAAWGDGYDVATLEPGPEGSFAVWYERAGRPVGVLAHRRDESYKRGRERIAAARTPRA
jgi:3-phenylpropionate/trans-cinnamate dioxygenase ferredoxin reductase subunit